MDIQLIGSLSYELRKDSKDEKVRFASIRASYHLKGSRVKVSTGLKCSVCNWDMKAGQAIYYRTKDLRDKFPDTHPSFFMKEREVIDLNSQLIAFTESVQEAEQRARQKVIYDAKSIADLLKHKPKTHTGAVKVSKKVTTKYDRKEVPTGEVLEFLYDYIRDSDQSRVEGSMVVFRALQEHLSNFQNERGEEILFSLVDTNLFEEFRKYLNTAGPLRKNEKKQFLQKATILKQLSTFKTVLGYAQKKKIPVNPDYKNFKVEKYSGNVIALTSEELRQLEEMNFPDGSTFANLKDVFLMSCYTGLRYSDLNQLRWHHIKGDEIHLTIKKTDTYHIIPLIRKARLILEKYKDLARPLRVITNQKSNNYLKDLLRAAGIDTMEELTRRFGYKKETVKELKPKYELCSMHTGRKTFVTLSLEKGMSAEETMEISGHSSYSNFKRYVKITEKRKKLVINKAWDENYSLMEKVS